MPSPGQTTLTRLGPAGSDFNVDSFFDITYQIEFEGCDGSMLADLAGTTQGTIRMQAGEPAEDKCLPVCVNFDPATGEYKVSVCECRGPSECHMQFAPGTVPHCVGDCPPGYRCLETTILMFRTCFITLGLCIQSRNS